MQLKKFFPPAVIAALAALATFAVTLGGTFIYDDFDIFARDPRLHVIAQWWRYWTESYNGGVDNLYRPLVSMTYALQCLIHGDRIAWPFHLVNWLLHAAVAAIVATLISRMLNADCRMKTVAGGGDEFLIQRSTFGAQRSQRTALMAGVLFAVHPVHVEAVANIVGRAELMCTAGFLGAMLLVANRPLTFGRVFATLVCTAIAILSKEQGLLLAPMLLAMIWMTGLNPHSEAERRPLQLLALLICWGLAGYIVFRESILKFSWDRGFLDWTINPIKLTTGVDRLLMPFVLLGHYAALLFVPKKLSPDYGGLVIGWHARGHDPFLWTGAAAAVFWIIALVICWRRRNRSIRARAIIVCLLGLGLTYGVISNGFALIGTNFAERLVYLPSAFLIMIVAVALSALGRAGTVFAMALAAVCAVKSFNYAAKWNDRLGFYEYAALEQPKSIRLKMLLIAELTARGDLQAADREAADARDLLPEYDEIWIQSAEVAKQRGDFVGAEADLRRAMTIRPSIKAAGRLQELGEAKAAASWPSE